MIRRTTHAAPVVVGLVLAAGLFAAITHNVPGFPLIAWNQGDVQQTEDFDSLGNCGSDNTTWENGGETNEVLSGWHAAVNSGNAIPINVFDPPFPEFVDQLYSWGNTAAASDRALGAIAGPTEGDYAWGVQYQNLTGRVIRKIRVTYKAEHWVDAVTEGHTTQLFYRVDSGNSNTFTLFSNANAWTAHPDGDVTFNAGNGNDNDVLDGTDVANQTTASVILDVWIEPGERLWLGWLDPDNTGQDHGVGIDDLLVEAIGVLTDDFGSYANNSAPDNGTANPGTVWNYVSGDNTPRVINGELHLSPTDVNNTNGVISSTLLTTDDIGLAETYTRVYAGFVFRFTGSLNGNIPFGQIRGTSIAGATVWAQPSGNNNANAQIGVRVNAGMPDLGSELLDMELAPDTNYSVVLGVNFDNLDSVVWVNPANINDTNVNANDVLPTCAADAFEWYAEPTNGSLIVDDLSVATEFDCANPPVLTISDAGASTADTTPSAQGVVVGTFDLDAAAHVAGTLRELTLTPGGDIAENDDVDAVAIYLDRDDDGAFTALDDPALASDTFSSDDEVLTFDGLATTVAAGEGVTLFVVYNLSGEASGGETISVTLSDGDMFGRLDGLGTSSTTTTVEPATLTISSSTASVSFEKTGDSRTANVLGVTAMADGADVTVDSVTVEIIEGSGVSSVAIVANGSTIGSVTDPAVGSHTINLSPSWTILDGNSESFDVRGTVAGKGSTIRARVTAIDAGDASVEGLPTEAGVISIDNGGSVLGWLLVLPALALLGLAILRRRA